MKVLFIGGTGLISTACSKLAVERGVELCLLNRGRRDVAIPGARNITADIREPQTVRDALGDESFDVVVDWIAFTPEHIKTDIDLFAGRCGQYVFISSASAYQKPVVNWPITESTPLHNPYWEYSRNKIACEDMLVRAYRDRGFAMTIVRPSHTYGPTALPVAIGGGAHAVRRLRAGKPIIVHGDGTSLWTLTWNEDFAAAFHGLLSNTAAIGQAFHITSDEWLSWDQIIGMIADGLGVEPNIVHMPSDYIAAHVPAWGGGLLGDKAHCAIFDNTKIKRFVPGWVATRPFGAGLRRCIEWMDANADQLVVREGAEENTDKLLAAWSARCA